MANKFNNDVKAITERQKDIARRLAKSPNQSPFVKMDAKATLKQLDKLKKRN